MGLYVYRADEDLDRLPYAPYAMREEVPRPPELPINHEQCGTINGYKQHRYRMQAACDRCKTAAAEYVAEQRRRNVNRKA